jgi:hypothetical protein
MFSAATLAEARAASDRAHARIRARKAGDPGAIAPSVAALETAGMACAFGIVDGAHGGSDTSTGVAALLVGTALHAFAFMGDDEGRVAQHAQALGNGALAACAYRSGVRAGETSRSNLDDGSRRQEPNPGSGARRIEVTVARLSVARVSITSWP